jgi:hypothetical protein
MKTTLFFSFLLLTLVTISSCDKVENIYPTVASTDLDTTLYDGNWSDYLANEWPDFKTITASPLRNALIEDFTGHNCSNCPQAATIAHALHEANPSRVFIASIHSGPLGSSNFQEVTSQYNVNFMNTNSIAMGSFFGNIAGSGFNGNPSGTANRLKAGSSMFYPAAGWGPQSSVVLSSALKVAIKSKLNYFPSTKGAFVHTEVELLDNSVTNQLAMNVYLLQDTMVAPQNVGSIYTPNYLHRDIHLKNLNGLTFGRDLDASVQDTNGKYYLDYSFLVPNQLAPVGATGTYDAENMHILIYVYDKVTYEIYQVVKEKIAE